MSAMPTERMVSQRPALRLPAAPRHTLPTKLPHAALGLSVLWQLLGST